MLKKFLRKDLTKRIGINVILCVFMLIATVFLSASFNNILTVANGIDYFFDVSKLPDITLFTSESENEGVYEFLEEQEDIESFSVSHTYELKENNIQIVDGDSEEYIDSSSSSIYYSGMPKNEFLVYDTNNNLISLEDDEIGITVTLMDGNDLKVGDKLKFDFGGYEKEYTIKCATKDAGFGSEMAGMTRIVFTDEELARIRAKVTGGTDYIVYSITTDNNSAVSKTVNAAGFKSIYAVIDRATFKLMYSMDMLLAAAILLVGICFILIAFLVLRFTIIFTMEENYSEIGIMQAIGITIPVIRKMYISKYAILVLIGSAIGLAASVPFGNALLNSVTKKMVLAGESTYIWSNIAGAVFVILVVLLFCYGCTRKIQKMSVIDTIRGGSNGERYHKRKGIKLHTKKHMGISAFLGTNDVLSGLRKYIVLFFTFSICFVLITIPLNTVNTMDSNDMIEKFCLDPSADVFLNGRKNEEAGSKTLEDLYKMTDEVLEELHDAGFEDVKLTIPLLFNLTYNSEGEEDIMVLTSQILGDESFREYSDGVAPKLENEIAFSKNVLDENGWNIGDTVYLDYKGKEMAMVITGTYSDYLQLGKSVRINQKLDFSDINLTVYWNIGVFLGKDMDMSNKEIKEYMETNFDDYNWAIAEEILEQNIGGIKSILKTILIPLTLFLGAIIALVVVMMEQLFIVKEKGEIAMMKSMGFTNNKIRQWQIFRMVLVVILAMIFAIPLSLLSNNFMLEPVFGIMGASVNIKVNPLEAYLLYPGILLVIIVVATIFATFRVRKISIQELNNIE